MSRLYESLSAEVCDPTRFEETGALFATIQFESYDYGSFLGALNEIFWATVFEGHTSRYKSTVGVGRSPCSYQIIVSVNDRRSDFVYNMVY